jgi:hypothetical protein
MRRPPLAVLVFAAWTVLVWVGRVRNVLSTTGSTTTELLLPVMFVLLGLGVVAVVLAPTPPPVALTAVRGAAAVSTVVWLVRVGFIAVHDHPAGFKAVHVGLAVVSIALAAWASRAASWVGGDQSDAATV